MKSILDQFGRPIRRERKPQSFVVRRTQSYDAARTNSDNRRHWQNADALSAAEANSLDVRKKLRERARYESANNSFARGMILTCANDLIGTGPRLQVLTENAAANNQIETAFSHWAKAARLAEKLHVMAQAKRVDGESFAILATNRDLGPQTPVQLDVYPVECDRVTDPDFLVSIRGDTLDGIQYDRDGNPVAYTILDEHPGDLLFGFRPSSTRYPARQVIHLFRPDRIGQLRGVSEITPALPLFAQLRRYTLAVIAAAESAADFAAVLQSKAHANTDEAEDAEAFEELELTQRMMTVLPKGWELGQIDSKQPATTYEMFVRRILAEIARCLNMPYIIASGDYAGANYASGRLAHQVYFKSIQVERATPWECVALGRIFAAWLDEAVMIDGLLPAGLDITNLPHTWFWDGWVHVDPTKEAQADQIEIANCTKSRTEICAKRGMSWEDSVLPALAKERELMEKAGVSPAATATTPNAPANDDDEEDADVEDEEVAYASR